MTRTGITHQTFGIREQQKLIGAKCSQKTPLYKMFPVPQTIKVRQEQH